MLFNSCISGILEVLNRLLKCICILVKLFFSLLSLSRILNIFKILPCFKNPVLFSLVSLLNSLQLLHFLLKFRIWTRIRIIIVKYISEESAVIISETVGHIFKLFLIFLSEFLSLLFVLIPFLRIIRRVLINDHLKYFILAEFLNFFSCRLRTILLCEISLSLGSSRPGYRE